MNTQGLHWGLGLLLALSSLASAAERLQPDPFQLTARNAEEFRLQAAELRSQLQPSGSYAAVDAKGRASIETQLQRLQALYDRHEAGMRTDTLASQTDVVNAAEAINGVLAGDLGDRLICQQVKPLGSNRIQKVCQTLNDREHRHRESQLAQRDMAKWIPIQDTKMED